MHDKRPVRRYVSSFLQRLHRTGHFLMRNLPCLTLLAATLLPAVASANCYSVYDTQNRLNYQSNVAPIDLSLRISDAMRSRFPTGYMVMIPDGEDCREFRSGGTVQPRFDNLGMVNSTPNNEVLLASPLMRNTRSTEYGEQGAGSGQNDLATREAVRSVTSLSIKRESRSRP